MKSREGIPRRSFLGALAGAATLAPALAHAQAGDYPNRPIRLVVPFSPGGSSDAVSRLLSQKLSTQLGQQVVVDSRPGAGGNLGADLVAKSKPDGYTLLFAAGSFAVNVSLYEKLPYDPLKDFEPVAHICRVNGILVTHPSVKANSVQDLIALAKAQPGTINFASAGNGTILHLAGELFKGQAGVNMTHVPYRGSGPALSDLIGGQVQVMFANVPGTLQHVKAGKLRVLAATGDKRASSLPEVPTIAEAGVPGFQAATWFGVLAPAGTPKEIVAKVNAEINKALAAPEMVEHLRNDGADVVGGTPEQFRAFLKAEIDRWGPVVKAAGIKPN
ncbi:tripartite tricarboxylate transporter substrate binding protein [Ramlibacter albus]|uniref:Tripartite tricarboxylate transporter substrate binding protein n=1 Tax=Ramlibacter albus TaxID=2079448 RepID=A0A923S573_9BURK|nr:tripartite tricarboxylate transporter substrate binding protein [Ramlibacter albus]MBC5768216.1 tripartite tricarboxylate transporter substrate binding protein [Ramlibacter albus]